MEPPWAGCPSLSRCYSSHACALAAPPKPSVVPAVHVPRTRPCFAHSQAAHLPLRPSTHDKPTCSGIPTPQHSHTAVQFSQIRPAITRQIMKESSGSGETYTWTRPPQQSLPLPYQVAYETSHCVPGSVTLHHSCWRGLSKAVVLCRPEELFSLQRGTPLRSSATELPGKATAACTSLQLAACSAVAIAGPPPKPYPTNSASRGPPRAPPIRPLTPVAA